MRPHLTLNVLTPAEIASIHNAMLSILSRTGLAVENAQLRSLLADFGAHIDGSSNRVRFPVALVERFLSESTPFDYTNDGPRLTANVGIYQGMYLEPGTNRMLPFTPKSLAGYIKLARRLDNVTGIQMQNYPLAAASPTEPLELRIFAWKHGASDAGSIQLTALCPYLLEMYQIKADAEGTSLHDVFRGVAFTISPLRIPAIETEQLMYFHARGLRVNLTNMLTAGGSAPVTLAGSVALNLAERIAIGIINRVLWSDRTWSLGCSITPLDMRTMIQPYGRPEMLLANLATMQLARHYGARSGAHGGLTDAKLPSNEAGMQKMLTAWPCILAGGANVEPGLLSIDEVFSPIQMIIDAELVGAMRHAVRGFEVNDETLAVDLIDDIGPGGLFTGTVHTARHFRQAQWQPDLWSREMLQAWLVGDRTIDTDRALDRWHALMALPDFDPGITPETEARLQAVVDRAKQVLH